MSAKDMEMERARRERIMEAARVLIFHYGFKKTTMQDIATEAGMSVGAIYNFFRNKEDIMIACAQSFKRDVVEDMRAVADGDGAPEAKLKEMMLLRSLSCLEHLKDSPHGIEIVTALSHRSDELRKKFEDMEVSLVAGVIAEGVASSAFSLKEANAREVKDAAATFLKAFYAFSPPQCISVSRAELKKDILKMVDMLLPALGR